MAGKTAKQGAGILGVGAAACTACCAPPVIAFLAAASVGTLMGIAAFGLVGLAILVPVVVAYLRRRRNRQCAEATASVPVVLGARADA
jgi:Flp pilus assembly protein TadB